MKTLVLCVLVSLICAAAGSSGAAWDYTGHHGLAPEDWHDAYHHCDDDYQSPIDLVGSSESGSSDPFYFDGYNGLEVDLTNNGHTAQVTVQSGNPSVSGGGLPGTYNLAQFHFHWGSDNSKGSEHKIGGTQYPLEVHFVHYHTRYDNLGEAADQTPDGLAVLSFMFEIASSPNSVYEDVFHRLEDVEEPGSTNNFGLDVQDFLNQVALDKYYRYQGSLTTPGCYESVVWTVFEEKIKISNDQIEEFRKLKDDHEGQLVNNFRPIQDRNRRPIHHFE